MALDSYSALKTAIAAFADVTAADISSVIDDAISIAERRIWDELRIPEMETSLSYTISVTTVSVPSGYLDLKYARYEDSDGRGYPLEIRDARWMREQYPEGSGSGRPLYIGRELTKFIFKPTPDVSTYVLKGVHYARTAAVSLSVSDNLIFAKKPEIYLFASLVEIERTLKRPTQIPHWEAEYQRIKNALNMDDTQGNDRVKPTTF